MNQFGNLLKSARFAVWIVLLAWGLSGCQDNVLKWNREQACISYDGKETCFPAGGSYRLRLKDGKPEFTAFETKGLPGKLEFPQYAPSQPVAFDKMSLAIENGKLVLLEGETRMVDEIGIGFLLMKGAEGRMEIMVPVLAEAKPHPFKFDQRGFMIGQKQAVSQMEIQQAKRTDIYLAMTSILRFGAADGISSVPNDTGTIVIIIDNYSVVGSCDATAPDDCCAGSEVPGGMLDASALATGYAESGLKLLACFPAGSICYFVDGDKVIIVVCESAHRYCLTVTEGCPIYVTPGSEAICFSVPLDCSIVNPFIL